MQKYKFRKYTLQYKDYFRREKIKLESVLSNKVYIEHVGSTAVPGLGGKGVLDIIIGSQAENIKIVKNKLIKAGYEYRAIASTPDRLFFRRDYKYRNSVRRVHIHLTKHKGKDWQQMIKFRDYLLTNPDLVKEYENIKKKGVRLAAGEGEKYRKYKEKFVNSITKQALKNI